MPFESFLVKLRCMDKTKKKKGSEICSKETVFRLADFVKPQKKLNSEICSNEELLSFASFYKRFKRLISLPIHCRNIEDVHYEKAELVNNLPDFLRTLVKILSGLATRGEKVTWNIRPESMLDIILLAEGHTQLADDPLPRGMISLKPDEWRERELAEWDLDMTIAKLCKYLGVKKEDLIAEGFFKREPCTREEFLRIKSIHKGLNFLIDHKSKKTDSAYSHRQTKVFEDIKDFWPRLNQISRLLNVPLEIGLNDFKVAIFGSKRLSKAEAKIIYSKPLYNGQELPMDDVIATEEERLRLIAKENLDELMVDLCKHFKRTKHTETKQQIKRVKESPKTEAIMVDEERSEVKCGGKIYPVTERQAKLLKQLNEKPGVWTSGSELKKPYTERLDKVKNKLPKPILKLIESHTRKGYRLITSSQ